MFNYMPGIGSTGPYIPTYPPLRYTGVLPQYQHMVGVGNQYLSPADQARVSSPYWTGGGMGGGGGSSAPPSGGGSSGGGGQQGTWPGPTIGTPQTRDQRLAEIRAPLLVIHGTADPIFPIEHGVALSRAIAGATLIRLEGGGHELHEADWDDIIGAIVVIIVRGLSLRLGLPVVVLGHILVAQPFVILIVMARLQRFDQAAVDAARDLGATRLEAFRLVTLPQIASALVGAALVSAAISLDDFIIASFTIGGGNTLSTFVWGKMRTTLDPSINASATILITLTIGATLLALWLSRYRG